MNNKFLDKVCNQIVSETRVNNDVIYAPFFLLPSPPLLTFSLLYSPSLLLTFLFSSHCKEIYSLNEQEIDYVWGKYKEGVTTLMEDKELV